MNVADRPLMLQADVAIVGAGAAGLAAARECVRRGVRAVVLEARDAVGGRARSIDVPGFAEPIELGPEFVHGSPAATLALLREFGIANVASGDGDAWVRDADGLRAQRDGEAFDAASSIVAGAAAALPDDADATVDEALRDRDVDGWARSLVAGFDAADTSRASVRAVAREWAGDELAGQSRVAGGYGRLFAALARTLDPAFARLRMRTIVREIVWRRGEVRVRATGVDGVAIEVVASRAVVTLPVGVLAADDVRFEPALPIATTDALRSLASGAVVKVVLAFRSAWWERIEDGRYRDAAFFHDPSARFPTVWTQRPARVRTLTAWAGGNAALALAPYDEARLVAFALDGLRELFGAGAAAIARDELIVAHAHDWQRDPFARGAYSYALVGAGDARARLAAPIDGTLAFAGEAAIDATEAGTIAGALASGTHAVAALYGGGADAATQIAGLRTSPHA